MENKKSKIIIIIISIIAVLAVIAAVVVLATGKGRALKKQLNLGQKYLAEMNYEEAIAVFEKALEIDPMSADAYIGIADAYIAMANEKIEAEDYEGALSTLNEAKTALEKGIEILSGAGNDTSLLEEKLSEIEEEIVRVEKAAEEKRIAEEEARLKAEEEMRLAALPYIELQPILDACSNVWGRNWDEWTPDDFRQTFNIQTFIFGDGRPYEADREFSDHYTYKVEEFETNTNLKEVNWTVHQEGNGNSYLGVDCKNIIIIYSSDYYLFEQVIAPGRYGNHVDGNLYDYAMANDITDVESFISFCGVEGLDSEGDTVDVLTDYGEATMTLTYGECKTVCITLNDGETNSVISDVSVSENEDAEYSSSGTMMSIAKYMQ